VDPGTSLLASLLQRGTDVVLQELDDTWRSVVLVARHHVGGAAHVTILAREPAGGTPARPPP